MIVSRREILCLGGGAVAALALAGSGTALAEDVVDIAMQGRGDGSKVWFDPIGVLIKPGQTVRWTNRNPGNSHTTTAYSPDNFDRPLRMPAGAKAWNSDFLLPNESFSVRLTVEGVYDYYCIPHEHAGMVGRIVVGSVGEHDWTVTADAGDLPEAALKMFPTVERILEAGTVHPA
jgi:plastocyanin